MGANSRFWSGFSALAKREGIGRVIFAAVVLPIMLWQGASAFLHRYRLEHDGNVQTAVVQELILKHCYGFRCSDPVFFKGEVGSPEYDDFSSSCGKACWWLVRYRFPWRGRQYSIIESVYPKRFKTLGVGARIRVDVDALDPEQSELVESTKDSGIIFVLYLFGGFVVFAALAIIGVYLNKALAGEDGYFSR